MSPHTLHYLTESNVHHHHELLYTMLPKSGVDSELIVYENEAHNLTKLENIIHLFEKALGWLRKHME